MLSNFELIAMIPILQISTLNLVYSKTLYNDSIFVVTVEILHDTIMICSVCLLLAKMYLLYFDYKFNVASANQIWRLHIEPNETNFYINNKKIFGNQKYILIIVAVFTFLILIIYSITNYIVFAEYSNNNTQSLNTSLTLIDRIIAESVVSLFALVAILAMFSKIKQIFDKFKIRDEIGLLIKFLAVYLVLQLGTEITVQINLSQSSVNITNFYYLESLGYLLESFYFAATSFVQVCVCLLVCTFVCIIQNLSHNKMKRQTQSILYRQH